MKRTCKTCVYHDTYGNCWNPKGAPHYLDLPQPRKSKAPACAAWVLAPRKLTTAFRASLDKAREKHPKFIDLGQKYSDYSIEYFQEKAESLKGVLETSDCQLRTLLNAEVYAFLFEFARGNFDRALEEAGDIMAVLYRALNGDGRNKKRGEEASK